MDRKQDIAGRYGGSDERYRNVGRSGSHPGDVRSDGRFMAAATNVRISTRRHNEGDGWYRLREAQTVTW